MKSMLIKRLLTLEKSKSFARAAEELHISRPALVQQVKLHENEIGFMIFDRRFDGVRPTEAGEKYLKELNALHIAYNKLLDECLEISGIEDNRIVIGTLPNFASIYLPKICSEFKKTHPDTKLVFKDYSIENIFKYIDNGECDVGVEFLGAYYTESYPNIEFTHLCNHRYHCAVPKTHPLANANIINFSLLRGEKLIMYKRGISRIDDSLRNYITKNEPEISIIDIDDFSSSTVDFCLEINAVIPFYAAHRGLTGVKLIETDWDIKIPLALCHHKNPKKIVKYFLKKAEQFIG